MRFPDFPDRVSQVRERIAAAVARGGHRQHVTIVAVTKTHGVDAVRAAWDAGLHDVGENRVQEALHKMAATEVPVRWHLIGHLQRNKVGTVDRFALVHSIDSDRLADAVHAHGAARGSPVDVLIQVNVSGEATKGGFAPVELAAFAWRFSMLTGINVRGVMTMAPLDADATVLHEVFSRARESRDMLAAAGGSLKAGEGGGVTELSMGMSNDYEAAVEEGATMVRLGTILFGARDHD